MASEVTQWRELSRAIRSKIDISALIFSIVSGDLFHSFVLLSSSSPSPKPSSCSLRTWQGREQNFGWFTWSGSEGRKKQRIIITGSSSILKVRCLERLNYQFLISLGEMNNVLPLGLPWVQNRSVERVGTSVSLLPVETEGRATGLSFCGAHNLAIYHFLVASCLFFLCKNTRGKSKWHNHRIRSDR